MDGLEQYSDFQIETIEKIIEDDKGFHTSYDIADYPFAGMFSDTDDGSVVVSECAMAEISNNSNSYTIKVWKSESVGEWFFLIVFGDEEYRGILHYNTVYNSKGETAFVFLNNSELDTLKGITMSLPYTNILVMRK